MDESSFKYFFEVRFKVQHVIVAKTYTPTLLQPVFVGLIKRLRKRP